MKILSQIRRNNKVKAFTLTEVIIAAVIFSLAMAGIFASISQLRAPAVESTQEVTAAFLGKQVLDNLRSQINAQTWNAVNGNLIAGQTYGPYLAHVLGGQTYNYTYSVIADPNGTQARQVTLNVTW